MSVALSIESAELQKLQDRLQKIGAIRYTKMSNGVGAVVESQVRRRIQDEKQSAEGKPWKDWSERYAGSKHGSKSHKRHPGQLRQAGGHSILSLSGALLDSIQYNADLLTGSIEVGSNLKYANRQNFTRPFLGVSKSNEQEILDAVEGFLKQAWGSF